MYFRLRIVSWRSTPPQSIEGGVVALPLISTKGSSAAAWFLSLFLTRLEEQV